MFQLKEKFVLLDGTFSDRRQMETFWIISSCLQETFFFPFWLYVSVDLSLMTLLRFSIPPNISNLIKLIQIWF